MFKKFVWLGRWGGLSPKPTHLVTNARWISELECCKPPVSATASVTTTRYVDRDGRRRCTGTKLLKQTQRGTQCLRVACTVLHVCFARFDAAHMHMRRFLRWLRSYPKAFGRALARLVGKHMAPKERALDTVDARDALQSIEWLRTIVPSDDLWTDARMDEVIAYLFTNRNVALVHARRS